MRLLVLVSVLFHRRACRLGSHTTNRFFNYSRDIHSLERSSIIPEATHFTGIHGISFPAVQPAEAGFASGG